MYCSPLQFEWSYLISEDYHRHLESESLVLSSIEDVAAEIWITPDFNQLLAWTSMTVTEMICKPPVELTEQCRLFHSTLSLWIITSLWAKLHQSHLWYVIIWGRISKFYNVRCGISLIISVNWRFNQVWKITFKYGSPSSYSNTFYITLFQTMVKTLDLLNQPCTD